MLDTLISKSLSAMTDEELSTLQRAVSREAGERAMRGLPPTKVTVEEVPLVFPGTRVRTKDNLKPRYICGREGQVVKTNQTTADVRLDSTDGVNPRYLRDGNTIRVPMKCLERL